MERVKKVKENEEMSLRYLRQMEDRAEAISEGRAEGEWNKMKELTRKKLEKGKAVAEIADAIEEDFSTVERLIEEIKKEKQ